MNITRLVREMNPPRYTIHEAARLAGLSHSTLKRWRKDGIFVPVESRQFGQWEVALYRPEDIPALIQLKKTRKRGPKPKEDHGTDDAATDRTEQAEAPGTD